MKIIRFFLRLITKLLLALVIFFALVLVAFNWPVQTKNENMKFGVSFSSVFARDIGLDWQATYLAILDELGVKRMRIGAYWTEIEKEKGQYDFSQLDWQVQQAQKRNVDLIVAFGIKAPRWPECFIPEFYGGNPIEQEKKWDSLSAEEKKKIKSEREDALLSYEKTLIKRYKDYDNIKMWQVENEPFLPFGHCVPESIDEQLVDREIAQVRELDTRPIMVTDSGELSLWYQAAKRADIFGTTLYRIIYKPPLGYVPYPLGPNFFRIKAALIKLFAKQENVVISELQGEPWGPDWLPNMSEEEQYKSMDPEKFQNIIVYAQKTNFSECYIWGAEWWYWLKEKKQNEQMWDAAKKLFSQENKTDVE